MRRSLLLMIALLPGISIGCREQTDLPVNAEPLFPEYTIVSYSDLPRPFQDNVYFSYGGGLQKGSVLVLQHLAGQGFQVREAWEPDDPGPCAYPTVRQVIVRLEAKDNRIYEHGFVSDSSLVNHCAPTWRQYMF